MKEYADNSHVWMTPAKEYAAKLAGQGFDFMDFANEHPNLAGSEYGQDLREELKALMYNGITK